MKILIPLIICALVLSMSSFSYAVAGAPTTTVYHVTSPSHAIAGSEAPLAVSATVYYNNTVVGYRLVVGVLDAGLSPQRIVPGAVVSSTAPCANQPEASALCAITVPQSSGVVRIGFQIGGIFGDRQKPGIWDLNVTSALIDHQNTVVAGSVSSKLFKINLTPVALNVNVPSNVAVTVDGVLHPAGSVSVGVALGQHTVAVPQLVNVTQSTRLKFDHWSDGYPSTLRTIVVTDFATLQADYITQNLLTLIGVQDNSTVSTWYDASSNATFSTIQYVPMSGGLGELSPRLLFLGWYENGQLVTDSPTGRISMDRPRTLTAVWQVDFSEPVEVVLGILTVAIIAFLLVRRRNRTAIGRSWSKRARSHS
jgi:hypothetical protein